MLEEIIPMYTIYIVYLPYPEGGGWGENRTPKISFWKSRTPNIIKASRNGAFIQKSINSKHLKKKKNNSSVAMCIHREYVIMWFLKEIL